MDDDLKRTIRLVRRPRVATDERGRSVWADPVESAELELVSTAMLEHMLASGDEDRKERLREAARGRDGVLAQNLSSGRFEIIDDADLKAALAAAESASGNAVRTDVVYEPVNPPEADAEELSLVSTQVLKRMLKLDDDQDEEDAVPSRERGFDPYNRG